jgi:hypothetical protein
MRGDGEEAEGVPTAGAQAPPSKHRSLLRVEGSGTAKPSFREVELRREFKGPRVQDLLRPGGISELLPGRAVHALAATLRGDLRAAEELLPGTFARVLPGPWQRARGRHLFLLLVALLLVLAVVLALVAV